MTVTSTFLSLSNKRQRVGSFFSPTACKLSGFATNSLFPYEVNEQIEWLSSEASKALGLDIAGVDLLFQNGGYKICEVNSNPGFEGMEMFTKKNIAGEIVSFIKLKLGLTNG